MTIDMPVHADARKSEGIAEVSARNCVSMPAPAAGKAMYSGSAIGGSAFEKLPLTLAAIGMRDARLVGVSVKERPAWPSLLRTSSTDDARIADAWRPLVGSSRPR